MQTWPKIERVTLSILALATGIIHLTIVPGDWRESPLMGIAFLGMAAAFLMSAIMLPGTNHRRFDQAVITLSVAVAALYVAMRILPQNPLTHEKEHFEVLGNISTAIELAMAAMLAWFTRTSDRPKPAASSYVDRPSS
jgi:hypothetical protein